MAELADLPVGRQACLPAGRRAGLKMGENVKWFVYCLSSRVRKYIYVGLTDDLARRVGQHNEGRERTTRPYRPFDLIHIEEFSTRQEARRREVYLKSGAGKEFLRALRDQRDS